VADSSSFCRVWLCVLCAFVVNRLLLPTAIILLHNNFMPSEDPTADLAPPPLERIVEALLFVGGAPLTPERACEAVRGLTPEQLPPLIDGLNRAYRQQGRPYRVERKEHGYELTLVPRYRPVVDRLFGSTKETRLSPAALAVLALVAYRQPVTKSEVDSLRGAESGAVLRQLVRLGLIAVQRGPDGSKDVCYGTAPRFLTLFGLRTLDDLPRTHELQRL
jgi:segregation and condensation protein B